MKHLLLACPLLFVACSNPATSAILGGLGTVELSGGDGGDTDAGVDGGPGADGGLDAGPMVICGADPAVDGGLFVDATAAWNLSLDGGLGVIGNRISAADLDGDGYPDLVIHGIASNLRQSITDGGRRLVWLLMNRPRPDGGRMFVDATIDSGFFQVRGGSATQLRSAQLAIFADIDNDGDLDSFSGTYVEPTTPLTDPGDRSEVMINDGHGNFSLAPPSAPHPAANQLLPLTSAAFVDADRDGKIDLFTGYWYERYGYSYLGVQAQLFKGSGDGLFSSATAAAGLLTDTTGYANGTNHRPAYGVTACDLDGDGASELMVSAYGRSWNLLYLNDGTGKFTEHGRSSGYAGDSNTNYSDNQFFACYCTVHPAQGDCLGVAPPLTTCPTPADSYWGYGTDDQPWRLNGNTFTTLCADLDNDGVNDLYNAEIKHWHIGQSADGSELLRNRSAPQNLAFDRPGNAVTGMSFPHVGASWNEGGLMAAGGDLDNDGRQDVVVAASDYPDQFGLVFQQQADHTFIEQGQAWGLHHPCVSGLTIADFDRDGDLDVIVGSGTARDCGLTWKANEVHLYENKGTAGSWMLLSLVGDGVTTNKSAIGARVTVKAGGRTWMRELGGGYGHFGIQNDTVLHFGLAGCDAVDEVTVRWPNAQGTTQTWKGLAGRKFYRLTQGNPVAALALP